MENIFKDAYFGKAYKTRDGRKAIFQNFNGDLCEMILPDCSFNVWQDGLFNEGQEDPLDIVSEWREEINEEELDGLAAVFISNHVKGTPPQGCEAYIEFAYICYKAGYRKAKEE